MSTSISGRDSVNINNGEALKIAETLEPVFGDLLFEESSTFFWALKDLLVNEEGMSPHEFSERVNTLIVDSLESLLPVARQFTEKFGPSASIRLRVFERIFYAVMERKFDDIYSGLADEDSRNRFLQSLETFISQADKGSSHYNRAYYQFLEVSGHLFVDPVGNSGGSEGTGTQTPVAPSGSMPPATPAPTGGSGASAAADGPEISRSEIERVWQEIKGLVLELEAEIGKSNLLMSSVIYAERQYKLLVENPNANNQKIEGVLFWFDDLHRRLQELKNGYRNQCAFDGSVAADVLAAYESFLSRIKSGSGTPPSSTPPLSNPPDSTPPVTPAPTTGSGASASANEVVEFGVMGDKVTDQSGSLDTRAAQIAAARGALSAYYVYSQSSAVRNGIINAIRMNSANVSFRPLVPR